MAKSTAIYWNTFAQANKHCWQVVEGTDGQLEALTLAMDEHSGDYTRLTRFKAGADTQVLGAQSHDYPEEIFVVQGRLYDQAFDRWLEAGDYASRPPGELHGPFRAESECIVLEVSYPSQALKAGR